MGEMLVEFGFFISWDLLFPSVCLQFSLHNNKIFFYDYC